MVALLKNVLTFGTIFVLRKKGKEHGYDPSYKCPGGPIMPLIAIIMKGTLIWGQLTYCLLYTSGVSLLRIVAISEPMYAALIIYEGIFHGIGDTKMPFIFAILTMWGIRIGLTWIYIGMFGRDVYKRQL